MSDIVEQDNSLVIRQSFSDHHFIDIFKPFVDSKITKEIIQDDHLLDEVRRSIVGVTQLISDTYGTKKIRC